MKKVRCFRLEDLGLSTRAKNCLYHGGIDTEDELLALSEEELMAIRYMGPVLLRTIVEALAARGKRLRSPQAAERERGEG